MQKFIQLITVFLLISSCSEFQKSKNNDLAKVRQDNSFYQVSFYCECKDGSIVDIYSEGRHVHSGFIDKGTYKASFIIPKHITELELSLIENKKKIIKVVSIQELTKMKMQYAFN